MTNYNHIINITKTILQFTAINNTNISNYNYTNQTINQVCFSLYTMFNNTKINPVYNLLINTISPLSISLMISGFSYILF